MLIDAEPLVIWLGLESVKLVSQSVYINTNNCNFTADIANYVQHILH